MIWVWVLFVVGLIAVVAFWELTMNRNAAKNQAGFLGVMAVAMAFYDRVKIEWVVQKVNGGFQRGIRITDLVTKEASESGSQPEGMDEEKRNL